MLTTRALYVCGYDFTAEKLVEYARILLGDIMGIRRGVYILSPHEGFQPENHWGLVIDYLTEERRLNTASMKNVPPKDALPTTTNFVAFRAVVDEFASMDTNPSTSTSPPAPREGSAGGARWSLFGRKASSSAASSSSSRSASVEPPATTSHGLVDEIVASLVTHCIRAGACDADDDEFVKEQTIQSLAQAKANASLFAPLIEGLKRRVWL